MYAVIKTGGKQYRVSAGDTLEVEHLSSKEGEASFVPVLVVTDDGKTIYGSSAMKEYVVRAKILGDAKGDKVTILKYRPKSGYAAKSGHRQLYSLIEITAIGDHKKPETPKAEPKPKAEGKSKTEAKSKSKPKAAKPKTAAKPSSEDKPKSEDTESKSTPRADETASEKAPESPSGSGE